MSSRFLKAPLLLGLAAMAALLFAPRLWAEDEAAPAFKVQAEINAQGLAALLRSRTPVVLLDARGTQQQFVPTAKPCPPNASAATVARLARNKKGLIVTYDGGAQSKLDRDLAERLAREGYVNVIRFPGGVEGWTKARYKLQQAAPPPQEPRPAPSGSGSRGSSRRGSGSR